jgi:hypothetical protein
VACPKLERIQYEAARIVTGLTRSASIEHLLREISWVFLENRRKMQKLCIMYTLKSGQLPDIVGSFSNNHLRNVEHFRTISRRTTLFVNSFALV